MNMNQIANYLQENSVEMAPMPKGVAVYQNWVEDKASHDHFCVSCGWEAGWMDDQFRCWAECPVCNEEV